LGVEEKEYTVSDLDDEPVINKYEPPVTKIQKTSEKRDIENPLGKSQSFKAYIQSVSLDESRSLWSSEEGDSI
jgi:hypothetical protein